VRLAPARAGRRTEADRERRFTLLLRVAPVLPRACDVRGEDEAAGEPRFDWAGGDVPDRFAGRVFLSAWFGRDSREALDPCALRSAWEGFESLEGRDACEPELGRVWVLRWTDPERAAPDRLTLDRPPPPLAPPPPPRLA